ncbi:phosphotransferase [Porticoccus sp. W117]|uniref:aminoglycoside phosphotransferase family protein n=1 Tax=Porticoccus sp. W117 TaxID=3054777 RepID=UPI00259681CC|nr:phosphotransferase [Porticoccus sp. W117]MDM3870674.1 phosphotransferase [Porticoccus sp. W117]
MSEQPDTKALQSWLLDYLPASVLLEGELTLSPLNGDAGFRRYFRLNTQPSLMAVWAPPQWEDSPAFVSKALAFQDGGIHTPQVYAVDYHNGYLLIEDFGDQLYAQDLTESRYAAALQTLQQIQTMTPQAKVFPKYDKRLLADELGLFPQWFLGELLHLELRPDERELIQQVEQLLIASALEQPQVVVHRDYHCRNLMILNSSQVGVIDFQDAVIGAVTYDLVSILKDCYQLQQKEWIEQQALAYARQLRNQGQLQGVSDEQFLRWFDWMGLQRHIKVLGIFSRLSLRDGKHGYLNDLPLVIRYTLDVAARYPELAGFNQWFHERVLPALPQHPWYKDWQTAGE